MGLRTGVINFNHLAEIVSLSRQEEERKTPQVGRKRCKKRHET